MSAAALISRVNGAEITKDRSEQSAYEIFSIKRTFKHLSFDLLCSRSLPYRGLQFEICYFFKMHYYFIARCTLTAQMAKPVLSRFTWALLKYLFKLIWVDICCELTVGKYLCCTWQQFLSTCTANGRPICFISGTEWKMRPVCRSDWRSVLTFTPITAAQNEMSKRASAPIRTAMSASCTSQRAAQWRRQTFTFTTVGFSGIAAGGGAKRQLPPL